ncbi:MAG: HAD hydrolase-like protein, partial [Planctomycetota bacterium]
IMLNAALEELELDREDCLMFGDRTETDIRMARDAGITSVLVLTGVTDRDHVNAIEIVPDLIMRSIGDLLPVLEEL